MIKAVLFDFSRVLLFPIDESYKGSLNKLHKQYLNMSNYSVFDQFKLNLELLTFIEKVLRKVKLYILTSETIQEAPEFADYLNPKFKKIYSALQIGLTKKDPEIYKWVAKDLNLSPEEIMFIDDSEENIKAAKIVGLETIHYQSNDQLIRDINNLLY